MSNSELDGSFILIEGVLADDRLAPSSAESRGLYMPYLRRLRRDKDIRSALRPPYDPGQCDFDTLRTEDRPQMCDPDSEAVGLLANRRAVLVNALRWRSVHSRNVGFEPPYAMWLHLTSSFSCTSPTADSCFSAKRWAELAATVMDGCLPEKILHRRLSQFSLRRRSLTMRRTVEDLMVDDSRRALALEELSCRTGVKIINYSPPETIEEEAAFLRTHANPAKQVASPPPAPN